MIKIEYNGESGYFITTDQKKQLDKIVKTCLENCGDDYNDAQLL